MIGSLASAVSHGLQEQGQVLLGGDLEFTLVQREASSDELAYLNTLGKVSHTATMRAMAQSEGASTLVELKAADDVYPLYGKMSMLRRLNGCAPKSHDAIAHVFVDSPPVCPDQAGQTTEDAV